MMAAINHRSSVSIQFHTHTRNQQLVGYLIEQNNKQMDSLKEAISRNIVEVRKCLFTNDTSFHT